ncbi:MAG: FAD-binding and (Fe-S)-binding domain-containing protein [Nocardioides sp.]
MTPGTASPRSARRGATAESRPAGELVAELRAEIATERVLADSVSITKYAADASAYLIRPSVVVLAASVADVRHVLAVARRRRTPVTFRAAGTSLSGQAQTDGILCEVQRHWRGITVLAGGELVRLRPGTVGGVVNAALGRYGVEIGPDPASISACTIGGIVANNSSGMCCGVDRNAYHTLRSLTFVLADGTVIDSGAADAERAFAESAPELADGLLGVRRDILADPELVETIRRKYRMKNTTGYGLNALLDFETPLRIFEHLLVGSEGTLAFISEVTLRTVPLEPYRRTALLLFGNLTAACDAVADLAASGARAIELMDGPSLLSAGADLAAVVDQPALVDESTVGLLVEWRTPTLDDLAAALAGAERAIARPELLAPAELLDDPTLAGALWAIRKGLLATIGGHRPSGSSIILEDIVFPPRHLAAGTAELRALLDRHGYDGVIFGHAKDGNLHFLISERLGVPANAVRYDAFMSDLVDLVVHYEGALKGEHGTGRNMAPFVAAEWGQVAVQLMHRIKLLADPDGVLNPGTIISTGPRSHVEHLKSTPLIDVETDRCVECGFCERGCPSGDLTATPRQRIALRRRLASLRESDPRSPELAELEAALDYQVLDTCAADGMCQLACPVGIDTGDLVRRLRAERHPVGARRAALSAARRFADVERAARGGLAAAERLARLVGPTRRARLTRAVAARLDRFDLVPVAIEGTPPPAAPILPRSSRTGATAVYFPACVNRIFGSPGEVSVPEALLAVAARAGATLWIPPDATGACCTTPWVSKGFGEAATEMARTFVDRAAAWTDPGAPSDGARLPIVIDASSCTHGLRAMGPLLTGPGADVFESLTFVDSTEFVAGLLPALSIRKVGSVAVHPSCANHRDGSTATLITLADAIADSVLVPSPAVCCGFGGDRGFLHPELTASATAGMAAQIGGGHSAYLSSNRTCEIGMTQATGQAYESFILALERQTRDSPPP